MEWHMEVCDLFVTVLQLLGFQDDTEKWCCFQFQKNIIQSSVECNLCFRFVSSLPLTDFKFTISLSHDVPLATSLGHCLYVFGSIQRTGEKLLLQYNTRQGKAEQHMQRNLIFIAQTMHALHANLNTWKWVFCILCVLDCWSELFPTLTRADADLPALYFLGATDRLLVIGGNNSETLVTSFCLESQRWGQVPIQQNLVFYKRKYNYFLRVRNYWVVCLKHRDISHIHAQYSKTKLSLLLFSFQVHRTEKVAFAGQGTIVEGQVLLMPSIEHNAVARMDLQTLSTRALPPLPISTCYEAIFYLNF